MVELEVLTTFLLGLPEEIRAGREQGRSDSLRAIAMNLLRVLGYPEEFIRPDAFHPDPSSWRNWVFDAEVSADRAGPPWLVCSVSELETLHTERDAWLPNRMLSAIVAVGATADIILTQHEIIIHTRDAIYPWSLANLQPEHVTFIAELVGAPPREQLVAYALAERPQAPDEVTGDREDELTTLWQAVEAAETAASKGQSLERFARTFLKSIEGVEIRGANVRTTTSELDIVCRYNNSDATPLALEGPYFLVECKHRQDRAGAAMVRDLAGKMDTARVTLAVLLSLAGATGANEHRDARGEITFLWQRQPRKAILLLDRTDVVAVLEGRRELLDVLVDRYERVRFGLSRSMTAPGTAAAAEE